MKKGTKRTSKYNTCLKCFISRKASGLHELDDLNLFGEAYVRNKSCFVLSNNGISFKSKPAPHRYRCFCATHFKHFWLNDLIRLKKVMRNYHNKGREISLRLYPYFYYAKSPQPFLALRIGAGRAINLYSVFHNIYLQALRSELGFMSLLLVRSEEGH